MFFYFLSFFRSFAIPAWIVLIYWFGVQVIDGAARLAPVRPDVVGRRGGLGAHRRVRRRHGARSSCSRTRARSPARSTLARRRERCGPARRPRGDGYFAVHVQAGYLRAHRHHPRSRHARPSSAARRPVLRAVRPARRPSRRQRRRCSTLCSATRRTSTSTSRRSRTSSTRPICSRATINQRIDKSFITPIDREDIHTLASRLDDVIDLLDGTSRRFAMLHITEVLPPARQLAGVLMRAANEIQTAVSDMRKPAARDAARRVHQAARGRGRRDLSRGGRRAVRRERPDPLEVIKWKEMYDTLEQAIDSCMGVAQVLQSISLKNA